jgi:hypothetical protein
VRTRLFYARKEFYQLLATDEVASSGGGPVGEGDE